MQNRRFNPRYLIALCCSIFLLSIAGFAGGCSFIFDFEECATSKDCIAFDDSDEEKFFVCTNAKKCVLEVDRECREDRHCADAIAGPVCEIDSGKCVAKQGSN